MANITMKRYNGSTWEELSPSTTIAQVSGLQTALDGKQATLTFDSTPTSGSSNPVTSGGIYTAISNVTNVAEGKTKSYVCDYANPNTVLNSTADTITVPIEDNFFQSVEGEDFGIGDLKIGDVIYVVDTNVPDRWVGSITSTNVVLYKMETTKQDLSGLVTKTTQIAGNNIGTGIDTATLKSSLGITNVVNTITSGTSTTGLSVTTNTSATGNVTVNVNTASNYAIPTSAQITQIGTNATNISSKADDSSVVHLAGQETIAGRKTFNNTIVLGHNTGNASHIIELVGGEYSTQLEGYNGTFVITPDADSSPEHTITFDVASLKYADGEDEYEYNYPTEDGTISLNHTFKQSAQPTSANTGDIWFVTAS